MAEYQPPATPATPRGSDSTNESRHVRPPLQSRSRKTLERLVSAAMDIIGREGVEAATVATIVERAGSSVGSFYARFQGKEEFLRYLEERIWHEAREHWDAAVASESWGDLGLQGVVRSIVRLLVRIHEEEAGNRSALGKDSSVEGLGREARAFHRYLEGEVVRLLLEHGESIHHPHPARASRMAYAWMAGGVREILTDRGSGSASATPLPIDTVVEEMTRAITGYLGGRAEEGLEDESVDYFDVWQ